MAKLYIATHNPPPFKRKNERGAFFTPTQKTQVYDIIADAKDGITRSDVAKAMGMDVSRISFYLYELKKNGHIDIKGDPAVVSINMTLKDAQLACLLNLENAFVVRLREMKAASAKPAAQRTEREARIAKEWTDQKEHINREWLVYNKVKERALRPGTEGEGEVAMRRAILNLVSIVF